jgi:23S rRNA (uracil1939-C5)-methyltransferase
MSATAIPAINNFAFFFIYNSLEKKYDINNINHLSRFVKQNLQKSAKICHKRMKAITPRCPYFGICGGCTLQTMDYASQIAQKLATLHAAFERALFLDLQSLPGIELVTGEPWEYRSRFQLHRVSRKGNQQTIGFMARGNKTIIPVDDCLIAVPLIREMLAKQKFPTVNVDRFTVFAAENATGDDGSHIVFESGAQSICRVELAGKTIQFDVSGFFQSNMPLLEKMITAAVDGLAGNNALDLYSGAGVFGLFLSDTFSHVTLVEQNAASLAWAEVNMRNKPHTSFAQSGKTWLRSGGSEQHFDAVIADPPRGGLESDILSWLCETKPPSLHYVSCNPTALARDAAALVRSGYTLERLFLFDFYPQTNHIEALAYFGA